jgi:UDP-glucuronate decarboxylase
VAAKARKPRALVTGGAGFLGSHLCERLLSEGYRVLCMDNLRTGSLENIAHLLEDEANFEYVDHDVTTYINVPGELDEIYHFASPASPTDFERIPIPILKVGALGTYNSLGLALAKGARFMLASSSEVYGDPLVHPQPEDYWGNVNPVGIRGVYDEAKRYAEAITMAYRRHHGLETRVARIFNSIMADETVILFNDETVHVEPIGDYAAANFEGPLAVPRKVYVPAFDPKTFKVELRLANALIKHPSFGKDAFLVKTRYGRHIRVTGDHSVFRRDQRGEPEAVSVRELEVGSYVAVPARLPVVEKDRPRINIAEHLIRYSAEDELWAYALSSARLVPQIEAHRDLIVGFLMSSTRFDGSRRKRNTTGCAWRKYRRQGILPLPVAAVLWRRGLLEWPEDATIRPYKGGGGVAVRNIVPVTEDLLWLLGLYLAEGNYVDENGGYRIGICSDEHLIRRAIGILESHFGLQPRFLPANLGRAPALYLDSKLLVYAFREIFRVTGGSKAVRIPAWIIQLPLSRLKHFLEGYREGDGTHTNYPECRELTFNTVSEGLATDLTYLLLRFGIVASVGSYSTTFKARYGDRAFPFWRVTVCEVSDFDILSWDQGVEQRLNAQRLGDLVWARAQSITPVEATSFVYDFSVEGYENFVAGNGVFAHNTYGPRMRPNDGRMIPSFVPQALSGKPLTVHGDGTQTRSIQYVDDLIEGVFRLMKSSESRPVNLGNPVEMSVREVAQLVIELSGSESEFVYEPLPQDDPKRRCPEIRRAKETLGWEPRVPAREGLRRTLDWFAERLAGRQEAPSKR